MSNFIKYKRFFKSLTIGDEKTMKNDIQEFLDDIISEGFEIVHYSEYDIRNKKRIVVIGGKKNQYNII